MRLKSLFVSGFKNLHETTLITNNKTIAVISPNNYGKSNLLEALDFAVDFISASPKQRLSMMAWTDGIPLTPAIESEPFRFSMEFEDPSLGEYRFVRYGFSFCWYRDNGSGQKILDEHLEMRQTESVKYTSYLKGKSTSAYRNIVLDDNVLAVDILSSVEDLEYNRVLQILHGFEYRVCDALDVKEKFQFTPFRMADEDDKHIRFDDEDIPRALYQLKTLYPEQYLLFEDAIYTLFPEFKNITVQAHELSVAKKEVRVVYSNAEDSDIPKAAKDLPFQIKDKVYRVFIESDYLNQPVNLAAMSTGTKRIFWLLTNIFIASCTNVTCIGIEELETSIHPRMLQSLLEVVSGAMDQTCLIISSHSPYLVQYLKPEQIYIGTSDKVGVAQFFKIQNTKVRKLINAARTYDLSVGEYLFELMSGEGASMKTLQKYLEGIESGE